MAREEPLLVQNSKRFVLFPIHFHEIWNLYKNIEAKFWAAEEIEFSDDQADFEQFLGKDKSLMIQILCLLASNDSLLGNSVVARISHDIQSPEARSVG
jgi:ribonucleoside-diphosphate reductase subunit M2